MCLERTSFVLCSHISGANKYTLFHLSCKVESHFTWPGYNKCIISNSYIQKISNYNFWILGTLCPLGRLSYVLMVTKWKSLPTFCPINTDIQNTYTHILKTQQHDSMLWIYILCNLTRYNAIPHNFTFQVFAFFYGFVIYYFKSTYTLVFTFLISSTHIVIHICISRPTFSTELHCADQNTHETCVYQKVSKRQRLNTS